MVYNPATDFIGLWRNIAGAVSKMEMPGLDYAIAALARAGLFTLSVSATAPVVNQSTTAWLKTAVPSYSAEGALFLWNADTDEYEAATAGLFFDMLQRVAGRNGASLRTTVGAPANILGINGDFAIRTDEPGGIYGPKAAGLWPPDPLPGTTDIVSSAQLDQTFGATEGQIIYRGPTAWEGLAPGSENMLLSLRAGVPSWHFLTVLLDTVLGDVEQGSVIYRGIAEWTAKGPGTAGGALTTQGPGADPSWVIPTPAAPEFPSGTVMLFQQTAAPTGWTKQTALNDYGLRVTSGAVGVVAGSGFSTVFAQTAVGATTLDIAAMPVHNHTVSGSLITTSAVAAAGHAFADSANVNTTNTGGGGSHLHSVNLTLSYVDVIIASKD